MAITYIDYIDKIKLSEDEVYEIADTKARSQIVTQNNSILSALTNSSYASLLADNALLQLSIIEDVAGTLDWITSHGAFVITDDEEVHEETIYFLFNQETGDYDPIVYPDTTKNPHEEGWYILDISDSQTKFIMAHLAVTTRGLWVLPSRLTTTNKTINSLIDRGSSKDTKADRQANANARQSKNYKLLLSNDGVYIYDGSGREVVKYGSSIEFSGERPFTIGTENAYIAYYDSNDDGIADTIRIDGNTIIGGNVSIGEESKTLSQLLNELDSKLSQTELQAALQDAISVTPTSSGAVITINGQDIPISNGQPGDPGTSYYTYIRYSASSDGSNMVVSPTSDTIYMGIYTGTSTTAPSNASSYYWSLIKGADGLGFSTKPLIEYGTIPAGSTLSQPNNWSTVAPSSLEQGTWLWIRNTTSYSDGSSEISVTKSYIGTDGDDGNYVLIQSTQKDQNGKTTVTFEVYNPNTSSVLSTYSIEIEDGPTGQPGPAGYTHFAWADQVDLTDPNSIATTGFVWDSSTVDPVIMAAKKYLGVYSDNIENDSTVANSYSWSLIKGANGAPGASGRSLTSVTEYYLGTENSTPAPTTEENFGTSIITPSSSNKYVWNYQMMHWDDNGNQSTSVTIPHIIATFSEDGNPGQPGQSLVGVTEYYYATSATAPVPNPSCVSYSTQVILPDPENRYIWNYELLSWENYGENNISTTTRTEPHIIAVYSDSLTKIEEYYAATTASTDTPTGFTTAIITPSSEHRYIWNYEKLYWNESSSNYSTTAPHIIATFSQDGKSLNNVIEYYNVTSVDTVPSSTLGFSTIMQSLNSTYKYLWNFEEMQWSDGNNTTTDIHLMGMFSNGIEVVQIAYSTTSSGTASPQSLTNWTTTAPSSAIQNVWLWTRTTTTYTDESTKISYSKSYIGKDGKDGKYVTMSNVTTSADGTTVYLSEYDPNQSTVTPTTTYPLIVTDGVNGQPGQNGYIHIAWANSADGIEDFSIEKEGNTNKKYIGIYEDNTLEDSLDPSEYSWTLIKGADGQDGKDGSPGARGTVIVYPQQINWEENEATLAALLIVDGIEVRPSSYRWSRILTTEEEVNGQVVTNTTTQELQSTQSTYKILNLDTEFNATYLCTVMWSEYPIAGFAVAGITKLQYDSNFSSKYAIVDYSAIVDHSRIYDQSIYNQDNLTSSGLVSIQTGTLDLKTTLAAHENVEKIIRNYVTDYNQTNEVTGEKVPGVWFHAEDTPKVPNVTKDMTTQVDENNNLLYPYTSNGVLITDSVDIVRDGITVAQYGEKIRLGDNSSTGNKYLEISPQDGVTIYNNNNSKVAKYGEQVVLGDEDSFHIKIGPVQKNISTVINGVSTTASTTRTQLGFYSNLNKDPVAYMDGDQLSISKSVVLNQMKVGNNTAGQWSWTPHRVNGFNNLCLKWIGTSVEDIQLIIEEAQEEGEIIPAG